MRALLVSSLVVGLFGVTEDLSAQSIEFKEEGGQPGQTFSVTELKKRFSVKKLKVKDHVVKETVEYTSVPLRPIMEKVYGKDWQELDELLITCSDGYQPSLPVAELANRDAYLAFARADGKPFSFKKDEETVELGPFYLVWADSQNTDADVWSYQMVAIEPISFAKRFPKLMPPKGASAKVQEGFVHYRSFCVNCHKINGSGGTLSVELNYPVSAVEYWRPKYFRQWLVDPSSIRHATKMPQFAPKDKNREQKIDAIIAYLNAMKERKIKP